MTKRFLNRTSDYVIQYIKCDGVIVIFILQQHVFITDLWTDGS